MSVIVGAVAGLIGIILGGGVRAWEARRARRAEAKALLSALCAEVEAITRLINHRQYFQFIQAHGAAAHELVAQGRGDENVPFPIIDLKHNYFSVYEASVDKIGLLHPYFADRIARFYMFVKAVQENYHAESQFNKGPVTAAAAAAAIANDLPLLDVVNQLGLRIATFRMADPPKGISDPMLQPQPVPEQQAIEPQRLPALAEAAQENA